MKKPTSTWYKNRTWNGDIDTRFEKNLRYTRNPIHKAEYLLEQGALLLENPNQNIQEVGQVLLNRLLDELPAQHSPVLTAQEKLGDYLFKQQDYAKAAGYYKTVVDYCIKQQSRTNTSSITDLKLAACMLQLNQVDQFEKAYELLQHYPVALLKTADLQFYHAELGALLCDRMYKKIDAKEFAALAIDVSSKMKGATGVSPKEHVEGSMPARLQKLQSIVDDTDALTQ